MFWDATGSSSLVGTLSSSVPGTRRQTLCWRWDSWVMKSPALGSRLRHLVGSGQVEVHTSMTITGLESSDGLTVTGTTPDGPVSLQVDRAVPTTGFRPALDFLREVRLDLDPVVEAPTKLGP